MTFKTQSTWNPNFFELSPVFSPLLPFIQAFLKHRCQWPTLQDYNTALVQSAQTPTHFSTLSESATLSESGLVSGGGFPIRFVKQRRVERGLAAELGIRSNYQLRIFFTGEVPSRSDNWHDFFNMLSWRLFPRTKAALNMRQFFALDEQGVFPWEASGKNRNAEQDLLAVFDEAGVVVVTSDVTLWNLLVEHSYEELFVKRRGDVLNSMKFFVFGHALNEALVEGNTHVQGAGVCVLVDPEFWTLPEGAQIAQADEQFALRFSARSGFLRSAEFIALPFLGYPGYVPENANPEFYKNQEYFRPPLKPSVRFGLACTRQ